MMMKITNTKILSNFHSIAQFLPIRGYNFNPFIKRQMYSHTSINKFIRMSNKSFSDNYDDSDRNSYKKPFKRENNRTDSYENSSQRTGYSRDRNPRDRDSSDRNPRDRNSRERDSQDIKCFNCGEMGHYSSTCPSPKKERTPRRDDSHQSSEDVKCYNCGEMGHYSSSCTSPRRERNPRDQSANNQGNRGTVTCFNCLQTGHMSRECINEPKCKKCNDLGHSVKDCPSNFN